MAIVVTDVTEGAELVTSESSDEKYIASRQLFSGLPITQRDAIVIGGMTLLFLILK